MVPIKTFRKRWIVLTNDNKLYSYKQKKVYSNHTEFIDLNLCKDIIVSNKNQNQFILILNDNKQRTFIANSIKHRDEWIQCIQKHILKQNVNSIKTVNNIFTTSIKMYFVHFCF